MISVFAVLGLTDALMIKAAVTALTAQGPSMQLVFGFEVNSTPHWLCV